MTNPPHSNPDDAALQLAIDVAEQVRQLKAVRKSIKAATKFVVAYHAKLDAEDTADFAEYASDIAKQAHTLAYVLTTARKPR
jgi:hypothetical protein